MAHFQSHSGLPAASNEADELKTFVIMDYTLDYALGYSRIEAVGSVLYCAL